MKSLFAALILFTFTNAHATSIDARVFDLKANLGVIEHPSNYFGTVETAELIVNNTLKSVQLKLKFHQICPRPKPGQPACMAASRSEINIQLPIVSSQTGRCGSTLIVAQKDERPRDGSFYRVRILDHRSMTCRIYIDSSAMTDVELTEITAGFGYPARTYKFLFRGEALRSPFQR